MFGDKDCKNLAKILKKELTLENIAIEETPGQTAIRKRQVKRIVFAMADHFASADSGFDKEKFIASCLDEKSISIPILEDDPQDSASEVLSTRLKDYQRDVSGQIHCANCQNAKRVLRPHTITGKLVEKVRCAAGNWRTGISGNERLCDFYAIRRRVLMACPNYSSMGDENLREFLDLLPQGKSDYQRMAGANA